MTKEQEEQFYNLCQAYRHAPLVPITPVREAYDGLIDFVNTLIQSKELSKEWIEFEAWYETNKNVYLTPKDLAMAGYFKIRNKG